MTISIKAVFNQVLLVEAYFDMASSAFEFPLVQGDTGPKIRFNLLDSAGQPIGVSGAGEVKLFLRRVQETYSNAGHESCSAFDVPNALWDYSLQPGDVSAAGTYFGDVEITYDTGVVETAFEAVRFLVRENNKE